jgi:hypothetical protein
VLEIDLAPIGAICSGVRDLYLSMNFSSSSNSEAFVKDLFSSETLDTIHLYASDEQQKKIQIQLPLDETIHLALEG